MRSGKEQCYSQYLGSELDRVTLADLTLFTADCANREAMAVLASEGLTPNLRDRGPCFRKKETVIGLLNIYFGKYPKLYHNFVNTLYLYQCLKIWKKKGCMTFQNLKKKFYKIMITEFKSWNKLWTHVNKIVPVQKSWQIFLIDSYVSHVNSRSKWLIFRQIVRTTHQSGTSALLTVAFACCSKSSPLLSSWELSKVFSKSCIASCSQQGKKTFYIGRFMVDGMGISRNPIHLITYQDAFYKYMVIK